MTTTTEHHTIQVRAMNAHGVLPRILLVLSRRRLRLQALQFFDLDESRPAELQLDLDCDARAADEVVRQLARIVEVVTVRAERLHAVPAAAPIAAAV